MARAEALKAAVELDDYAKKMMPYFPDARFERLPLECRLFPVAYEEIGGKRMPVPVAHPER